MIKSYAEGNCKNAACLKFRETSQRFSVMKAVAHDVAKIARLADKENLSVQETGMPPEIS